LKISVQDGKRLSLDQIRAFLEASDELQFEASDRQERYEWVGRMCCNFSGSGLVGWRNREEGCATGNL